MYLQNDAGASRAISDETTGISGVGNSTTPGEAEGPTPGTGSPRESPRSFGFTRVRPVTDRSQATSLVQAALKSGRIVQADHDMRLEQIKRAQSDQEVELVVRDLQTPGSGAAAAATVAPVAGAPAAGQPWPLVNYGPGQNQAAVAAAAAEMAKAAKSSGRWVGGIVVLVVLISVVVPIVGVVIGLASAKDSFGNFDFAEPTDATTYLPGQAPGKDGVNVHTINGFNDLVAAVEEETGSTQVFDATMYPRYAVLSIPENATGKRYRSYYWDGRTLVANDFKSTTDDKRFDLARIDPGVFITLLQDVRGRIDKPTSWYVNIDSFAAEGPRMAIYATNEYGEGAYVLTDLEGTITYEDTY